MGAEVGPSARTLEKGAPRERWLAQCGKTKPLYTIASGAPCPTRDVHAYTRDCYFSFPEPCSHVRLSALTKAHGGGLWRNPSIQQPIVRPASPLTGRHRWRVRRAGRDPQSRQRASPISTVTGAARRAAKCGTNRAEKTPRLIAAAGADSALTTTTDSTLVRAVSPSASAYSALEIVPNSSSNNPQTTEPFRQRSAVSLIS